MAMPSATIIGIEALRQAGWTTQIAHAPEVAVNAAQTIFKTDRYEIVPRKALWIDRVASAARRSPDGLPVLAPAWALADLLARGDWGSFGLDPDDIEWDAVGAKDERAWLIACDGFGLAPSTLSDLAVHSRDFLRPRRVAGQAVAGRAGDAFKAPRCSYRPPCEVRKDRDLAGFCRNGRGLTA